MSHLVRRVGGLVALTATLAACSALAVGIPRVDAADGCVGPDSYCNPSTVPPAPTTTEATPSTTTPTTGSPSTSTTSTSTGPNTTTPTPPTSLSPSTSSPDTSEPSSTSPSTSTTTTPTTTPSTPQPSSPLDEPQRCPTNPNEPVGSPDCPTLALPVTGGGWLLGMLAGVISLVGAVAVLLARRPEVGA